MIKYTLVVLVTVANSWLVESAVMFLYYYMTIVIPFLCNAAKLPMA